MNNKGFASTFILFGLLVLFLLVVSILMVTINNSASLNNTLKNKIIDDLKVSKKTEGQTATGGQSAISGQQEEEEQVNWDNYITPTQKQGGSTLPQESNMWIQLSNTDGIKQLCVINNNKKLCYNENDYDFVWNSSVTINGEKTQNLISRFESIGATCNNSSNCTFGTQGYCNFNYMASQTCNFNGHGCSIGRNSAYDSCW